MPEQPRSERHTQNRVIALFHDVLGYRFLGAWSDRPNNRDIETTRLVSGTREPVRTSGGGYPGGNEDSRVRAHRGVLQWSAAAFDTRPAVSWPVSDQWSQASAAGEVGSIRTIPWKTKTEGSSLWTHPIKSSLSPYLVEGCYEKKHLVTPDPSRAILVSCRLQVGNAGLVVSWIDYLGDDGRRRG